MSQREKKICNEHLCMASVNNDTNCTVHNAQESFVSLLDRRAPLWPGFSIHHALNIVHLCILWLLFLLYSLELWLLFVIRYA